jgi:hypothetical protein
VISTGIHEARTRRCTPLPEPPTQEPDPPATTTPTTVPTTDPGTSPGQTPDRLTNRLSQKLKALASRALAPDYLQASVGFGWNIPKVPGLVAGVSGSITRDRNGQYYVGAGPSFGLRPPGFAGSATAGYATLAPGRTLRDFLSGLGFAAGGGGGLLPGSIGPNYYHASNANGYASQFGLGSTQYSGTGTYTCTLGPFSCK